MGFYEVFWFFDLSYTFPLPLSTLSSFGFSNFRFFGFWGFGFLIFRGFGFWGFGGFHNISILQKDNISPRQYGHNAPFD
jgi:hypothetical protein